LSFVFASLTAAYYPETAFILEKMRKEYMLQTLMGINQILGKQNSTVLHVFIFLTSKEIASIG